MGETKLGEHMLSERAEERGKSRRLSMILLVGFALVLLAGGAYLLGRQLIGGESVGGSSTLIDSTVGMVVNQLEAAEELPVYEPSVQGIVDHVMDNSIYVKLLPPLEQIVAQMAVEYGPTVEVVVTGETIVYEVLPSGAPVDGVVQEIVAAGSVQEIGSSHLITIWGEERGDRIVADVLKYNSHAKIVLPSGPVN